MKTLGFAIKLFTLLLPMLCIRAQSLSLQDSTIVIELNSKAWNERVRNLELSKKYAMESIRIASRLNYVRGLSYSFNIMGNYYKVKGLYDTSSMYYQKGLEIRKTLKDTLGILRSYRNIMGIEEHLGDLKKAIKTGLFALHLGKQKRANPELKREEAWIRINLGPIYQRQGDLEQAIILIREGKDLFLELQDETGIASACHNLAEIYEIQGLYSKALEEHNLAIPILIKQDNQEGLAKTYNGIGNIYYNIQKPNDALKYYKKNLQICRQYGFNDDLSGSLVNMGIILEALNRSDSAISYYQQALALSTASDDKEVIYESHRALGNLMYEAKDFRSAVRHLLRAEKLSTKVEQSSENNQLFHELSRAYSSLGNADSALFYSYKYSAANDSLNAVLRNSIELQSTITEKNQKLENQTIELALREEKSKHQATTIIGMWAAIMGLLIIFFLYYLFVRSKRTMHELKEQVKDQELKTLDAMLEGQQDERRRLATELHDTIGSMLSATKFSFKAMEKSMEKMVEENRGQYIRINTMLDETMDSVRRISHNIASGIFTEKGLEGALNELCQTFEQPGKIRIHLNVYGFDQQLEYTTEINIYRIVQELLTNIIRHANAREVTIQLINSNENINLTVEDDGRGFNEEEARKKKGMGLSNIDLRVKKLRGQWNIDSGKGRGTTIIIDIPVNNPTQ